MKRYLSLGSAMLFGVVVSRQPEAPLTKQLLERAHHAVEKGPRHVDVDDIQSIHGSYLTSSDDDTWHLASPLPELLAK
jgi:hypothetical protein